MFLILAFFDLYFLQSFFMPEKRKAKAQAGANERSRHISNTA
jgi:hypothetical protein